MTMKGNLSQMSYMTHITLIKKFHYLKSKFHTNFGILGLSIAFYTAHWHWLKPEYENCFCHRVDTMFLSAHAAVNLKFKAVT